MTACGGQKLTVTDDDAADLIFGHAAVHHEAERHQHPRQPRRLEHPEAQKVEQRVRVAPAPDVDQHARQAGAEEREREDGREAEQAERGERQQPGEVRRRPPAALLQQPAVALQEEDVEDEVEVQRAEVDEGGQEAPVLRNLNVSLKRA